MQKAIRVILCCMLLLQTMVAARTCRAEDDITRVLGELDSAATRFRTATAAFEWRAEMTDPVPDVETQTGTIYFKRNGSALQFSAHIQLVNQKAVPKVLSYSNGSATLYEALTDDLKVYKTDDRQAQLVESIVLLGFGSSGREIASKWELIFLRQETLFGVKCDVLQLIPKDPEVKKRLRQVTTWFDTSRAVPLKQIFDQADGLRRVCVYTHLTVNAKLPGDAFNPKGHPEER